MSIKDLKITAEQIAEKGVIACPDTLTGTANENKSVFDRLASEIIVPAVNGAIEMLGDVEDDTIEWASDEAQRQANESARVTAEQGRATAESARDTAEQGRTAAETARAAAEQSRASAETARAAAEQGRAEAEALRVTAETARAAAETVRAAAEQGRVSAESGRVTAEQAREQAEQQRADETAGIVAQATAQAQDAAADATLAESWAKGGTGTRSGEDTDNAAYYAGQAQTSAQIASQQAATAVQSASSAQSSKMAAQASETAAEASAAAAEASAASALQSASNAEQSKNAAAQSKSDAATSAQQSAASASAASQSASESAESKAAAASSASSASGSASAAAASEQSALESKNAASASAQAASASASSAAASQASAADSNTAAQSAAARAEQAAEDAEAIAGGDYIPSSQKGVSGGVAQLGEDGKVPAAQLPEMDYDPAGSAAAVQENLTSHTGNTSNPHKVTASQVGADPSGSAAAVQANLTAHTGNTNNPHGVTAAQAGAIPASQLGQPGGVAQLGSDGKVPADQLGAAGGSLLTVTFDESFAGLPYTLAGGEESYSGIVPASLEAVHSLLAVNTGYTLSIQNETFTITTEGYFTALELTAEPSTPIDVPTVSGTLTYTGEAQSPTWSGYDEEEMTIGGETSGTNSGTYTATFTPNAGYKWSDGTNTTKSVQWSIGKAAPTLTLNPTSLSLVGTTPKTTAISYNGDGALTAQSNNTGVATVSLSGTTLSVTAVASGSTTVTVRAASGTNYLAASATLSVSAVRGVSFAADSWATIAAIAESGIANQVYSIGDTKDIAISGVGTITLEIADFDHDYLSGSTSASKAGISMITRDLLPNTRQMNSSNTNVGGFPASALYDYLNGTILNGLPSDLRSALKTTYKWYGTGNNTENGQWHGCKVWIPLEYEMFGTTTRAPSTEHSTGNARKYPIFTDNASRIKRMNNGSGSAKWYWEASPRASNAAIFCTVGSNGTANSGDASFSCGVCFGLCV